jgi:hypothetical protein
MCCTPALRLLASPTTYKPGNNLLNTIHMQRSTDWLCNCLHCLLPAEFALDNVEVYMDSSDRWVNKAPLPEARFRFDTAHVIMGSTDRVLVFGGDPTCGWTKEPSKQDCVAVALDTVWEYFDEQSPGIPIPVKQRP